MSYIYIDLKVKEYNKTIMLIQNFIDEIVLFLENSITIENLENENRHIEIFIKLKLSEDKEVKEIERVIKKFNDLIILLNKENKTLEIKLIEYKKEKIKRIKEFLKEILKIFKKEYLLT